MNKQIKKALLGLALSISFSALSMDPILKTPERSQAMPLLIQQGSPKTLTFMVPPKTQIDENELPKDMKYLSQAWTTLIKESYKKGFDPSKNSLFFCTPIFTFTDLLSALKRADKQGVNVKLLISPNTFTYLKGSKKEMFKDFADKIRIYTSSHESDVSLKSLHAKLFLYSINGKHGYSIGSPNITPHGLFHNNEIAEVTDNDPENYKVLHEDLEKIWRKSVPYDDYLKGKLEKITTEVYSPLKLGFARLQETPEKKRSLFTSTDYKLSTILIDRLDPEKFEKDDAVWLSTFTFNSPELTAALCVVLEKGVKVSLYVDKDPFNHKEGLKQLKKLYDCGAQIYKYSGAGYQINHAKFMLIQRQGNKVSKKKCISIVSTQNVMEKNRDFDALSIDVTEDLFDKNLKIAKSYEENKNFKLVDGDAFEDIQLQREETPTKVYSKLDFKGDDISGPLSKKTKQK